MTASANTRRPAPPLSDEDAARVRDLVLDITGIDVPELRRGDLERAVDIGLRSAGVRTLDVLERRLRNPATAERTLEPMLPSLTVGETHFFRNRAQIAALEQHVLPELIARRRGEKKLRLWSAGCSSGEEPYTLAIMLDRLLGSEAADWDIRIMATDIDPVALQKAARAVYGSWSFREVPKTVVARYFTKEGDRLALADSIKKMVTFSRLNLIEDEYPGGLDLALCRNVLIYFRPETVQAVVDRIGASLVPGGHLVVGHVEPCSNVFSAYDSLTYPGTILYRRPETPRAARKVQPAQHRGQASVLRATATPDPGGAVRPARPARPVRKPAPSTAPAPSAAPRPAHDVPEAVALRRQGLELVEAGRADEAAEILRGALFLDPDDPVAHYALAEALFALGRAPRAQKALSNAAALLTACDPEAELPGTGGLTASRLGELIAARRALVVAA